LVTHGPTAAVVVADATAAVEVRSSGYSDGLSAMPRRSKPDASSVLAHGTGSGPGTTAVPKRMPIL
jgi:hypothetical protein